MTLFVKRSTQNINVNLIIILGDEGELPTFDMAIINHYFATSTSIQLSIRREGKVILNTPIIRDDNTSDMLTKLISVAQIGDEITLDINSKSTLF